MHCVEEVSGDTWVALRKESVDRNMLFWSFRPAVGSSLSARRAWIEMSYLSMETLRQVSLSARRAWIEITFPGFGVEIDGGRSPQGERG